jgi:hypothetical protein
MVANLDVVTVSTILVYAAAIVLIGIFAMFTRKLIKQHNDIYPFLYDLEEAEKKKSRGEG